MKNTFIIFLLFITGIMGGYIYGNLKINNHYEKPKNIERKVDTLPIAPTRSIALELKNGQKIIYMELKDLEIILSDRKLKKNIIYKINALFERLI